MQPFGQLIAKVLEISGGQIDVVINALEQKGLVRRLAQPNLIAMSGETASFHAGGEVPIQTTVANGATLATQTDYRPFGVRLTFTPVVLDGGSSVSRSSRKSRNRYIDQRQRQSRLHLTRREDDRGAT